MEYQLQQTGQEVQDILNQAPITEENLQNEITRSTNKDNELETAIENEQTRAEGVESGLQTAIDNEVSRAEGAEGNLQTSITNEKNRAEGVEGGLRTDVDGIEAKIPAGASEQNKLATESFVNSSVATNTADFKGTFPSLEALQTEVHDADANDYAFVISTDAAGNTVYNRYKYVTGTGWVFEYALNNSSFTAAQWAAIQSGITALLVAKLAGLPTVAELTQQLNTIIASVSDEQTRAEGAEAVLRQSIADNATAIANEKTRAQNAEGTLSTNVVNEENRAKAAEEVLQQNIDAEAILRDNADDALQAQIDGIDAKIPEQASASNQLADKSFVNSSIATNTADFKGTYNSLQELQQVSANNNDYGFVVSVDSDGNTVYNRYKYVDGTGWVFEYALNNSSFTSAQWAAIQSGITAALVAKLNGLPDITALNAMFAAITNLIPSAATSENKLVDYAQMVAALATKQNTLTFDNVPTENSNNPVKSGGVFSALATLTLAIAGLESSKQDKLTFDAYPTADSDNPVKSKGIYEKLAEKQATLVPGTNLDTTPTANSNNPVTSGGVKAALDLKANQSALAEEVSRAQGAESALGVRVSTNEADIAQLRALYNSLQESKPVPVIALPSSGQQQGVIYRLAGTTSYSDYMWNGSTWVLMSTYNNAIDPRPKKASQNLVTSGGVFDNMGALDISELNATENPHTLAKYADLSSALAAIPTDYQKGGMSIKFIQGTVQSSDNKYVQYRYMGTDTTAATFTNVANWQVEVNKETLAEDFLGLFSEIKDFTTKNYSITEAGKFGSSTSYKHAALPVNEGEVYYLVGQTNTCRAAFATSDSSSPGGDIPLVSGTSVMEMGATGQYYKFTIPQGCTYLLFNALGDYGTRCYRFYDSFEEEKEEITDKTPTVGSTKFVESGGIFDDARKIAEYSEVSYTSLFHLNYTEDSPTIATTDTDRCTHFSPVKKGDTLKIVLNSNQSSSTSEYIGFSLAIPQAGVAVSEVHAIPLNRGDIKEYYIDVPFDGYFVAAGFSAVKISLFRISKINLIQYTPYEINAGEITTAKAIEAYELSASFGSRISGVSNNYGTTDYIDIEGLDYILTIGRSTSAASVARDNQAGSVFFDSGKTAIGVASRYGYNTVSPDTFVELSQVPSGAKYIRLTLKTDDSVKFIGFKKDNRYASPHDSNFTDAEKKAILSNIGAEADPFTHTVIGAGSTIVYDKDSVFKMKLNAGVEYRALIDYPANNVSTSTSMAIAIYKVTIDPDTQEEVSTRIAGWNSSQWAARTEQYYDFVAEENEYYYIGARSLEETVVTVKFVQYDSFFDDGKSMRQRTIFEFNPDVDMYQKFMAVDKRYYTSDPETNNVFPLVLAHISDFHHGAVSKYQRFLEFANYWKDRGFVDEIIDTGDIVSSNYPDGISWRESIDGAEDIITVIGNHDTNASTAETEESGYPVGQNKWQYHSSISLNADKRNDAYNRYMIGPDSEHPYIDNWGVTQPKDAATNGLCYYYKDYANSKLRMIAVDVMGYDQTQDEWLQARLAETLDSNNSAYGYHVFIVAHYCGEVMTGLHCNYTSLFNSGTDRATIDIFNDYAYHMPISVNTFQEAGGVFVGYIMGHYHRDMVNILTSYPKQLAFAVSSGGKNYIRDWTKAEGCKNYDDFQIVSINSYDKTVRLIKVGADTDYYMRKKGTICVGYTLVKDDGTEPGAGETATKVKGIIGEGW